jgi:hypothetical protein
MTTTSSPGHLTTGPGPTARRLAWILGSRTGSMSMATETDEIGSGK